MSDQFVVYADGIVMGKFDYLEDAQDFADIWNQAYPDEPWFTVERQDGEQSND